MSTSPSLPSSDPPALVLGAGINGAAIARELLLNGVPVWLVDKADIASGTTSYSSRLVHGGLRYLEHAEFGLVRESLHERARLLGLASHLVQPLRLHIPVTRRFSGLFQSAWRFFGGSVRTPRPRGFWVVRLGLRFYDWISRKGPLPRSSVARQGAVGTPALSSDACRWLCSYSDAQVLYPERFVISLLHDARTLAEKQGLDFRILTYQQVTNEGGCFRFGANGPPTPGQRDEQLSVQPMFVVNSTGPWGDLTNRELGLSERRMLGGTKGSHLISYHPELRQALGDGGVYAEASDGRPVFVLPFGSGTLIGTTDIPFSGDPRDAVAAEEEVAYLLATVNRLFAPLEIQREDVDQHYCGVRPLPYNDSSSPAATTRRHSIQHDVVEGLDCYTVVGGKLTTCRALAEDVVNRVLPDRGWDVRTNSRERYLAGGDAADRREESIDSLVAAGWPSGAVETCWQLFGSLTSQLLADADTRAVVPGTDIPAAAVAWTIENEWPRTLADLVERRLMLNFGRSLSRTALESLAQRLVQAELMEEADVTAAVDAVCEQLQRRHGKTVD